MLTSYQIYKPLRNLMCNKVFVANFRLYSLIMLIYAMQMPLLYRVGAKTIYHRS